MRRLLGFYSALALALVMAWAAPLAASGLELARIKVEVNAEVTPAQVGAALGPWPRLASGVHYDWGLYLLSDNGEMTPLPQLGNKRLNFVPGPKLKSRAVFVLPPGKHRLRLLVEAYVLVTRTYDDTMASTVAQWQPVVEVLARPGQEITLQRRLEPGRQPPRQTP